MEKSASVPLSQLLLIFQVHFQKHQGDDGRQGLGQRLTSEAHYPVSSQRLYPAMLRTQMPSMARADI